MRQRYSPSLALVLVLIMSVAFCYAQQGNIEYCGSFANRLGNIAGIASSGSYSFLLNNFSGMDRNISAFDVSDVMNPQYLSNLHLEASEYAYYSGICASGNTLYAFTDDEFEIINISQPSNPVSVNTISRPGSFRGAAVFGNYLLTLYTYTLTAWDLTSPIQPQAIDAIECPEAYAMYHSGNRVYIPLSGGEYSIISLDNPADLQLLCTNQAPISTTLAGVSGNILCFESINSVEIYDGSQINNPIYIGFIEAGPNTFVTDLIIQGSWLTVSFFMEYYHGGDAWHTIYDISNPNVPNPVYQVTNRPNGVVFSDGGNRMVFTNTFSFRFVDFDQVPAVGKQMYNTFIDRMAAADGQVYAYLSGAGVVAYDLSDPSYPLEGDRIDMTDLNAMQISDDLLITSQSHWTDSSQEYHTPNIIKLHDVSDPYNIQTISEFTCHGYEYPTSEIGIDGSRLMLNNRGAGVAIYDISNPLTPVLVHFLNDDFVSVSCVLEGSYLYRAAYRYDIGYVIQIYDLESAATPTLLGSFPIGFEILRIRKQNNLIYVGGNSMMITILDVGNPQLPVHFGYLYVSLNVQDMIIKNHALILLHNFSMSIYDISDPQNADMVGEYSFEQNPLCMAVSGCYTMIGTPRKGSVLDCTAAFSECSNEETDSEIQIPALSLRCYPNPVRDQMTLNLKLQDACAVEFSLYNARGQKLASLQPAVYKTGMNNLSLKDFTDQCPALSSGVYFIRARAGNQYASTRFVLLK